VSNNKPTPILPPGQQEERPLFIIMTTMAFLAALTLLIVLMGLRQSTAWQDDLSSTATVQILSSGSTEQAINVLENHPGVRSAEAMSPSENRELLGPWIGDLELPDDLQIPSLIKLDIDESTFDGAAVKSALATQNIEASIDDHGQWRDNLSSTWSRMRTALISLLAIILGATIAISSFATQSVLLSRQNIINVLGQVGATDEFIAKLFVKRFLSLGFKAAITGTVLAVLFAAIFSMFQNLGTNEQGWKVTLQLSDFFWLVLLALVIGFISALTAGYAARRGIQRQSEVS